MNKPLSQLAKIVFAWVAFNALLGAMSLLLFSSQTETLFFWKINPPINAALFGALYLGGALVVGWVTYRGQWEQARFLIPVLVSAGIMISITTLLHLDKFTAGIKLIYWLVIYIGAPLIAIAFYFQHERPSANWDVIVPISRTTRLIAIGLGLLVVGLGILMILAPDYAVAQWPWQTSPLMVRVFASWFSAFGVGLLWFHVDRDWNRMQLVATLMIVSAVLDLLILFIFRADITKGGINLLVYCFHLALFGAVGLLMHILQRRDATLHSQ